MPCSHSTDQKAAARLRLKQGLPLPASRLRLSRLDVRAIVGPTKVDALRELNPLCQVPTLVLPDGTVMTESVAILMWLAAQYPDSGLLPNVPKEKAIHLRWLVYLAANNYPAISIGDFPERWIAGDAQQEELKRNAKTRLEGYWQLLETHLGAIPDVLGTQAGALSVLITTMSYWRPGRVWFNQHCPHLLTSIRYTESDSRLTDVWARNFSI